MKSLDLSIISFNAMGLFSFDTLKGLFISRNILARMTKLAEMLKKENADIIAFQEIHTYSVLKLLRSKLKTYPHVAYKRFLYGPRGGLVIFSKLPIEETTFINFEKRGSIQNKSFVGHVIRNGILSCKIQHASLHILNTHLTPNMDLDWSKSNRFCVYLEAQLAQITKIMKDLSKQKKSILLAGDFNTAKDSYLYETFMKKARVQDIFAAFNTPTQHQTYIPKNKKAKRIDYIFLMEKYAEATIKSAKHLFQKQVAIKKGKTNYLSDHIGLKAEVTFRENG